MIPNTVSLWTGGKNVGGGRGIHIYVDKTSECISVTVVLMLFHTVYYCIVCAHAIG